jgi:hypothetical protein
MKEIITEEERLDIKKVASAILPLLVRVTYKMECSKYIEERNEVKNKEKLDKGRKNRNGIPTWRKGHDAASD